MLIINWLWTLRCFMLISRDTRVSVPVPTVVIAIPIAVSVAIIRWVVVYNMNFSYVFCSRRTCLLVCIGIGSNG